MQSKFFKTIINVVSEFYITVSDLSVTHSCYTINQSSFDVMLKQAV